jgi:hypothetical protein
MREILSHYYIHGDRSHVKIPAEEIIMLNFNNSNIDDYCPGDDITREVVEKLDNLGRSKQFEKALKLLSK